MGLQGDECSNPASQQGQTLPALFGWLLTEGYGYTPSARKGIPLSGSTLWRLVGCGGVVSFSSPRRIIIEGFDFGGGEGGGVDADFVDFAMKKFSCWIN